MSRDGFGRAAGLGKLAPVLLAWTVARQRAALATCAARWTTYLLVLVMPLSVFWPLGPPLVPGVLPIYVTPGLFPSDVAVGLVISAVVLTCRPKVRRAARALSFPLLGLAALATLTAPMALAPVLAVYTALRWWLMFILYLALVHVELPFEKVMKVFLAGLAIQALLGLAQVLHQGPLGVPGELMLRLGRERAAAIQIGDTWWLRAYGLTFHPNVLGGFMAVGLLLGLPLLPRRGFLPLWYLLGLGLVLSFSRSAWLATALTLPPIAAWLAWRQPSMRRPLAMTAGGALLVLLVLGALLSAQVRSRLSLTSLTSERASLVGRGELIGAALGAIAARPVTGIGAGNFPLAALLSDIQEVPHAVHNVPLLLAAEVGLLGGVLWLWLWLWPAWRPEVLLRQADPWPVVLVGAWLALGVIGLWDFYPWVLNSGQLLSLVLLAWISRA